MTPADAITPDAAPIPDSSLITPPSSLPPSPQKLLANRANAQRSTGPRTPEGKARAALNACSHGLRARLDPATLVPETERADFALLVDDVRARLDPQSPLEDLLAERIALLAWKLRRHAQAEARLFDAPHEDARARHEQQLAHNRRYRIKEDPPAPTPRSAGDLLANFVRTAATTDVDLLGTLQRYETATHRALAQALQQYRLLHTPPADDAAPANTDLHHHFHYHHHATTPARQDNAPPEPPLRECDAPPEPPPSLSQGRQPCSLPHDASPPVGEASGMSDCPRAGRGEGPDGFPLAEPAPNSDDEDPAADTKAPPPEPESPATPPPPSPGCAIFPNEPTAPVTPPPGQPDTPRPNTPPPQNRMLNCP